MYIGHFPIENALWDKNRGNNCHSLAPNELDLAFQVPSYDTKFHQNRVRIVTGHRQTNMADAKAANDVIIFSLLCYCSGSHK